MICERRGKRSGGGLGVQERKGVGPVAGSDVNFEWPLWLKLSTPPSFSLLPKPPGCLCMTSSPNYAPHTHVNLSCHNRQPPAPPPLPLNCTAPRTPYVSFSSPSPSTTNLLPSSSFLTPRKLLFESGLDQKTVARQPQGFL